MQLIWRWIRREQSAPLWAAWQVPWRKLWVYRARRLRTLRTHSRTPSIKRAVLWPERSSRRLNIAPKRAGRPPRRIPGGRKLLEKPAAAPLRPVYVGRITALTGPAPTGIMVRRGLGAVFARLVFAIAAIRITAISPLRLLSATAYWFPGVTAM